jgi:hypothetical protein
MAHCTVNADVIKQSSAVLNFIISRSSFNKKTGITTEVSRDNTVGTAISYWLDDRGVEVRVRCGKEFSLLHVVQTGSEVHPTSYPMGSGGKAVGA